MYNACFESGLQEQFFKVEEADLTRRVSVSYGSYGSGTNQSCLLIVSLHMIALLTGSDLGKTGTCRCCTFFSVGKVKIAV